MRLSTLAGWYNSPRLFTASLSVPPPLTVPAQPMFPASRSMLDTVRTAETDCGIHFSTLLQEAAAPPKNLLFRGAPRPTPRLSVWVWVFPDTDCSTWYFSRIPVLELRGGVAAVALSWSRQRRIAFQAAGGANLASHGLRSAVSTYFESVCVVVRLNKRSHPECTASVSRPVICLIVYLLLK